VQWNQRRLQVLPINDEPYEFLDSDTDLFHELSARAYDDDDEDDAVLSDTVMLHVFLSGCLQVLPNHDEPYESKYVFKLYAS
jgi:hypothetical protein